ncbi:lytic transglycosylase domain-containing protein [Nocardia aobensis]|uniref:Lytic transglycosylase domain-containing protein n=1 Tax=Nocardia aobensis TaxID=257277 RepID=A0ABW6PDX7_9NOCA
MSGPMLVPAAVAAFRPHAAPSAPQEAPATTTSSPPAPEPPRGTAAGIPEPVLAAYRNAELILARSQPDCGLTWNLLAGIGRVESGHARSGDVDDRGRTHSPILGPALDGTLPGNEIIRSSNGYVRAVGPMQFLPSTWQRWASDGNGDGIADPDNVYDAALAAGRYLCAGGADLREPEQRLQAVLRYNHSMSYASTVLTWSRVYAGEAGSAPELSASQPDTSSDPAATGDPAPSENDESSTATLPEDAPSTPAPAPAPAPMIYIPGLPPIPCGIFCPPPR